MTAKSTKAAVAATAAVIAAAGVATSVLLTGGSSSSTTVSPLPLTIVAQTNKTITFGWTAPAGAQGYFFYADGRRLSSTLDGSRTSVKFAKGAAAYRVQSLTVGAEGSWPPPVEPPPVTTAPPVTTSPPPPVMAPLVISAGGTYSVNIVAPSNVPAIHVTTTQAVIVTGVVSVPNGAVAVDLGGGATDVTLDHLTINAANARTVVGENFKRFQMLNSTVNKGAGVELTHGIAGSVVNILRNRQTNIQRQADGIHFGNFVQLREVNDSTVDIGWNEIVNAYNVSEPEDVISVYKSSHIDIHDNLLDGQSTPGNAYNTSSQNGITIDGDGSGPASSDIRIFGNTILETCGGVGITSSAADVSSHNNLTLNDGWLYLPDGSRLKAGNGYTGNWIQPGATRSMMRDDTVGYVNRDGGRSDFWLPGDVLGDAAAQKLNTPVAGTVTKEMVDAARAAWKSRAVAAGVKVGADT